MEGCFVAGADPELMLLTPEGKLTSAIPIVPGTKEKPHKVSCGAVQHDNVMAEFNVNPSGTDDEFVHNMREVLRELSDMVTPHILIARASANFPKEALQDEIAQVFGCDPDFDSWTLQMNAIDGTAALETFRSAGGHFHIGEKAATKEMLQDPYGKVEVVKMLDIFQGIVSIAIDDDRTAPKRRKLYGRAGAHRPKDYGVEYRALGNFWVRSPVLVQMMYELADRAVALTLDGKSTEIIKSIGEDEIQRVINESDKKAAKKIVTDFLAQWIDSDTYAQILKASPITALKGLTLAEAWGI
ncbi:hypothetical protein LCGC14_1406820 [marine sediment metagenome]|uniref:Uncharacterized protein n=1 Tax=marine sediment metagenome TaxID=412755 RepID=A0A0F9JVG9_9ZZZZ